MLFNSLDFIIFFVIVLAAISIWKYRKFQHLFIIISSLFFLYYTDNYLISLLILTILLHFYTGREIYRSVSVKRKKIFLIIFLYRYRNSMMISKPNKIKWYYVSNNNFCNLYYNIGSQHKNYLESIY